MGICVSKSIVKDNTPSIKALTPEELKEAEEAEFVQFARENNSPEDFKMIMDLRAKNALFTQRADAIGVDVGDQFVMEREGLNPENPEDVKKFNKANARPADYWEKRLKSDLEIAKLPSCASSTTNYNYGN